MPSIHIVAFLCTFSSFKIVYIELSHNLQSGHICLYSFLFDDMLLISRYLLTEYNASKALIDHVFSFSVQFEFLITNSEVF